MNLGDLEFKADPLPAVGDVIYYRGQGFSVIAADRANGNFARLRLELTVNLIRLTPTEMRKHDDTLYTRWKMEPLK